MFRWILVLTICLITISVGFGLGETDLEKENKLLKKENSELKEELKLFNEAIPKSLTRNILLRCLAGDLSLIGKTVKVKGIVKSASEEKSHDGYSTNLGIPQLQSGLLFTSPVRLSQGFTITAELKIMDFLDSESHLLGSHLACSLINIVSIEYNQPVK